MYTLEPLFAAGISAVLLGERIGANTIVGASFITTACIWSALELTPRRVIGAIRSRFNKKDVQVASVI
jgi:drug/metabolite transporter (DMT)-like permease